MNTSFTIEKDKTDRQYFRASAFPADEVYRLPDNQHCIYKKPSYPCRDRFMGNVPVHCGTDQLLLGYRNNSVASASLSQEQDLPENRR